MKASEAIKTLHTLVEESNGDPDVHLQSSGGVPQAVTGIERQDVAATSGEKPALYPTGYPDNQASNDKARKSAAGLAPSASVIAAGAGEAATEEAPEGASGKDASDEDAAASIIVIRG